MDLLLPVGVLVVVVVLAVVVLVGQGRQRRAESQVMLPGAGQQQGVTPKRAVADAPSPGRSMARKAANQPTSPVAELAAALGSADARAHELLARMAGDLRALLLSRSCGD